MSDHEIQTAWDALHHHERASKRRCPDAGDTLWCGPVWPEGDSEPRPCSDPGCMSCFTLASAPRYGLDYDASASAEIYEVPDEVIEQWASTCHCCSTCWEFPCAACCAGGVCDDMPCRCDDDSHDGPGDEGYFPEEDERC